MIPVLSETTLAIMPMPRKISAGFPAEGRIRKAAPPELPAIVSSLASELLELSLSIESFLKELPPTVFSPPKSRNVWYTYCTIFLYKYLGIQIDLFQQGNALTKVLHFSDRIATYRIFST